jgi:DNA polymerase-3 subunit delta
MQISANALVKHLSGTPSPVVVIVGDEPLAKAESLDSVRQYARKLGAEERTSLLVERQFNWQTVTQFSQHFSLFSSHRILEIHIPGGKPGVDGAKVLSELAQQPMPDTTTIITLPTLERESKNSVWYQHLQAHALVVEL